MAPAVSWCDKVRSWNRKKRKKKVEKQVNLTFSLTATVSKLNAYRERMKPLGKFRFQSKYSYYILWRSSSPRRETYPRNLIAACCVFPESSPAWRSSEHALPFSCTIQQQTETHSTQTVFDSLLSWMPGKLLLFRLYSMTKTAHAYNLQATLPIKTNILTSVHQKNRKNVVCHCHLLYSYQPELILSAFVTPD